jgi:hypothetical protein
MADDATDDDGMVALELRGVPVVEVPADVVAQRNAVDVEGHALSRVRDDYDEVALHYSIQAAHTVFKKLGEGVKRGRGGLDSPLYRTILIDI